jgi:DNA-binding response OmpR family regulator
MQCKDVEDFAEAVHRPVYAQQHSSDVEGDHLFAQLQVLGMDGAAGIVPQLGDESLSAGLRQKLQSDNYHVALISRNGGEHLRTMQSEAMYSPSSAVVLPFSWNELVFRLYELVRDASQAPEHRVARFADVCVDFTNMEVRRSGKKVTMTNQEFKTLRHFLLNPGRVLTRNELLNEAWGYEHYPSTRTVDNHVLRLRQKFEKDPSRPTHFLTVHRVGYRFVR